MGWVNFSFGIYLKTGDIDGMIVDISDLKNLEHEIVHNSDLEREKFGRELHDTLGQTLTGTAFLCRALMQGFPKEPAMIEERVGQIENLVNQALGQARHLAHGLAYTEVKPSGLVSHLKKLAAQANAVFGGDCKVRVVSKVILRDAESATNLYRIAQEAVHNAIKHSGSPRVEIRLEKNAEDGRMCCVKSQVVFALHRLISL
jgi:signal transduction histidine kinase